MNPNNNDADSGASHSNAELEDIFPITKFDHPDLVGGIVWSDCELAWINGRIKWAILAERESCAKVIEAHQIAQVATQYDWTRMVGQDLAEAIRARPNS